MEQAPKAGESLIVALAAGGDKDSHMRRNVASGPMSAKLLRNGTLKTYKDLPHGMITTQADIINADLLAFINESGKRAAA